VAGTSSRIRLTVVNSNEISGTVTVAGVGGTTAANGTWTVDVIDATHVELMGSTFAGTYTSGGTISDADNQPFRWRLESGPVENFPVGSRVGRADFQFVTGVGMAEGITLPLTDPVVEISWSDDGGQTYYAPIQRKLGKQAQTNQLISLIACTGRSSWNGRRWRLDVADPVYVGFMAGFQNVSSKVTDIG
jgi:hypothetical protein